MKRLACLLLVMVVGCSSSAPAPIDPATGGQENVVDETYKRIVKHHGEDIDPSKISEAHRTVLLVYHAHGILGNGGFQYLFEGNSAATRASR